MTRHLAVSTYFALGDRSVPGLWSWDSDKPLQVQLLLQLREWVISRDLVVQSLSGPVGLGDMSLACRDGLLHVTLRAPDETGREITCALLCDLGPVVDLLDASERVIPRGSEREDELVSACLDRWIASVTGVVP